MTEYRKVIVSIVGAAVAILAVAGIDVEPTVTTAVVTLLTAVGVWFFRNEPGPEAFESQDRERVGE